MKSKPMRREIERYYAKKNNISVERAVAILAHDKQSYQLAKIGYFLQERNNASAK